MFILYRSIEDILQGKLSCTAFYANNMVVKFASRDDSLHCFELCLTCRYVDTDKTIFNTFAPKLPITAPFFSYFCLFQHLLHCSINRIKTADLPLK